MFKKILVPLDGSVLAEQALEPALTLAHQTGGELLLLSVANVKDIVMTEPIGNGIVDLKIDHAHSPQRLTAYLEGVLGKLMSHLPIMTEVAEGDVASIIVDTAVDEDVDVIIMSTHGRSGLSRWVMGSVTERVLRHAPCPVLVLREAIPIKNILITLDGSPLSEYALEPGLEIARNLESEITLLGVQSTDEIDPAMIAELDKVEPGLGSITQNGYYHRTEDYLDQTLARLQPEFEKTIHVAPREGTPAPAILDYIDVHDIDLVVMATHGRTGLKRWRFGSVTEKVLHEARCALLIIRPPLSELE